MTGQSPKWGGSGVFSADLTPQSFVQWGWQCMQFAGETSKFGSLAHGFGLATLPFPALTSGI